MIDPVTYDILIIITVWDPHQDPESANKAPHNSGKALIHRLYIDMTSMVHRSATLEQHSDAPMHRQTSPRLA